MGFYGGGTVRGALRLKARTSPGLSEAGEGRIYFDQATNTFQVSENGGAYAALTGGGGGVGTLAQTLAAGDATGGNDIVVSTGDEIVGAAELHLNAADGEGLWIGGTGTQAIQIGASESFWAEPGTIVLEPVAGAGPGSYVGIYGATGIVGFEPGSVDIAGGWGQDLHGGGVCLIRGGDTDLGASLGGHLYVRGGRNTVDATNHGNVYVGDQATKFVNVGEEASVTQVVQVFTGGTLGLRGGAGGTFLGTNGQNYWSINSSGDGSLTTAAGGSLSLSADLGGIALTTEDVVDDYAGGVWIYGGAVTAGSAPGSAAGGWIDLQAGSCQGGEGEGGWFQLGAGNGRDAQGGFFQMWAGTCTTGEGDGGFFQLDAGNGGTGGGSGGYLGLFAGDARGGTDDGGDVMIDAGSSVGGTAGAIDIGTSNASSVNIGVAGRPVNILGNLTADHADISSIDSASGVQIGAAEDPMSGLILVRKGYMSLGEGSVAYGIQFGPVYYDTKNGTYVQFGPNSIYVDGDNNVIRSTDGDDVRNVFPFSDAEGGETYDLSGAGAIDASPLEPGSVTVRIILESDPTQFSEVTDDGAGAFAAGDVLPAGGTVNYAARTLTGVTAALAAGSRVEIAYKIANGAGGQITLRAGDGEGTAAGGDLTLRSGAGGATSGDSGDVSVDVGSSAAGTAGTISIGATNASAVVIGRSGVTTTINGTLASGSLNATGSVALGAISTISANTTLDATNAIVLVDASAGAITITLPAAAAATRRWYTIKKVDSSANAVTIDGDGAETIDGATTQSLAVQYDALEVVSNGTAWFIV